MHRWTNDDDLIAYGWYRLGLSEHTFGIEPMELIDILGIQPGSLKKKLANHKFIDGLGGLRGISDQAIDVAANYREASDSEVRFVGIEAVARALNRYTNGLQILNGNTSNSDIGINHRL